VDLSGHWSADFETKVADHIRIKPEYAHAEVQLRYYPEYLKARNAGEVDVYVRDLVVSPRKVLVCECKFRPGRKPESHPITLEEVRRFQQKKLIPIREREEEDARAFSRSLRFEAWMVTSATQADAEVRAAARECGIHLMAARLPRDWRWRRDWKIVDIRVMT